MIFYFGAFEDVCMVYGVVPVAEEIYDTGSVGNRQNTGSVSSVIVTRMHLVICENI